MATRDFPERLRCSPAEKTLPRRARFGKPNTTYFLSSTPKRALLSRFSPQRVIACGASPRCVLPRQGEVSRALARDGGVGANISQHKRPPLSHRSRDDSSPLRGSTGNVEGC